MPPLLSNASQSHPAGCPAITSAGPPITRDARAVAVLLLQDLNLPMCAMPGGCLSNTPNAVFSLPLRE